VCRRDRARRVVVRRHGRRRHDRRIRDRVRRDVLDRRGDHPAPPPRSPRPPRRPRLRPPGGTRLKTRLLLAPIMVLVLAGCAPSAAPTSATSHGERPGATELSEPQNTLLSVGDDGTVTLLDLLTEESREIGMIDPPRGIGSDGRFGFVATDRGVDVVDSGVWT